MIIEFRFKNFMSFRDETVFSMVASADTSLPENTIKTNAIGKNNLLCSAVIYGSNAAGKTNLIKAIGFVDNIVNKSNEGRINNTIDIEPFLLSSEKNIDPSEFEVTFVENDVRYQYGFVVNNNRFLKEWLVAYPNGFPQTWFEREHLGDDGTAPIWSFSRNLKGKNRYIADMTRPNVSFLSNAVNLNHRQLSNVFAWFQNNLRVITMERIQKFTIYTASLAKDDLTQKEKITKFLEVADFGISGFDIREEVYTEKDLPEFLDAEFRKQLINKKHLDIYMKHQIDKANDVQFPLELESSGTQRFFAVSGPIIEVLENGWTLFVDELDSSMHPLLVRYLVRLFHDPTINKKGAQIIFNTHDTTLMDCCLFRRDQIWFVEKDRHGCSHLYPLLDYSPRKNEDLDKGYLMGRYGAIPFLGEPMWGETANDSS